MLPRTLSELCVFFNGWCRWQSHACVIDWTTQYLVNITNCVNCSDNLHKWIFNALNPNFKSYFFLTIHGIPTSTENITTCMIRIIVAASNIGLPSALETSRVGISVLPDCLWGLFWPNLKIKSQVPVLKSKLCEPFHFTVNNDFSTHFSAR